MNGGIKDTWAVKNEFIARMNTVDARTYQLINSAFSQIEINSTTYLCYCMWDGLLNEIYQYLRIHRLSAQEFENLKNDEIRWINEKEQAMNEVEIAYQRGSIRAYMVYSTGIEYTKNRCSYLISLI